MHPRGKVLFPERILSGRNAEMGEIEMHNKRKILFLAVLTLALLLFGLGLSACDITPANTALGGATQVTDLGYKMPLNSAGHTVEQQNILDRMEVTNDPTKVMWIHTISLDGKIILRTPVAHKITSSGKRLEPINAAPSGNGYPSFQFQTGPKSYDIYYTNEFLQPDGTRGSSDNYVYWFDTQHRYYQWGTAGGLGYLLTDFPIDLRNPQDAITSLYNTDVVALAWQKLQEQQMCKNSGRIYDTVKEVCNAK